MTDPFSVLNVALDADEETIERAWRAAVLDAHPDRFADAPPEVRLAQEERTRAINDAYAALMDPVRRADAAVEYQMIHGHRPSRRATVPPPASGATEPPPPPPRNIEVAEPVAVEPEPERGRGWGWRGRRRHR